MIGRARRHVNGQTAKSAQALLWRVGETGLRADFA
jgi:hypothetical protein